MSEIFPLVDVTLVFLLVAVGIFGSLAVQSRSVRSFQFQVAIIILVWIAGEIVDITGEVGLIELSTFDDLPAIIHMVAMVLIAVVFWLRFYYAKLSGRRLIDDVYE